MSRSGPWASVSSVWAGAVAALADDLAAQPGDDLVDRPDLQADPLGAGDAGIEQPGGTHGLRLLVVLRPGAITRQRGMELVELLGQRGRASRPVVGGDSGRAG